MKKAAAGLSIAVSVILVIIIFILNWENGRLRTYKNALEKSVILLNENLMQYQQSEKNREKVENTASSYLKWKFVLKEQLDQSAQIFKDKAASLKNANKDKALASLLYYNLGLNQTINMDFDSAINSFEEAVRLDPKNGYGYYNLGLLYSTYKNDTAKAVDCYKKYIQIFPNGLYTAVVKERIKQLERAGI